ncbi:hypothetical protein E4T51_10109 [Aureobasidium sp. EXF-12344]|nr:hypothetical protein E4T51_10109 [Aureobasidium sp. EXF-12344]
MPNNKGSSDNIPTTDNDHSGNGPPSVKNTKVQTTMSDIKITTSNNKRKRADSLTAEDTGKSQPGRAKVCSLRLGTYFATFEQKDLQESHTLHMLVNSDAELDIDDGDIWRIDDAKVPTACLNQDRFTQATLHTAWLFLRNGKEPNMSTYSVDQKWDAGERFETLSKLFPDRGQLFAAATLFDLGLALRCPKLQRAAYKWYSEVRSEPSFCRWVAVKLPEERYRAEEYLTWLHVLREYDTDMIRLRELMIEAAEAGSSGLATDLPELEVLEPRWLYDYHMSDATSREIAQVDSAKNSGR